MSNWHEALIGAHDIDLALIDGAQRLSHATRARLSSCCTRSSPHWSSGRPPIWRRSPAARSRSMRIPRGAHFRLAAVRLCKAARRMRGGASGRSCLRLGRSQRTGSGQLSLTATGWASAGASEARPGAASLRGLRRVDGEPSWICLHAHTQGRRVSWRARCRVEDAAATVTNVRWALGCRRQRRYTKWMVPAQVERLLSLS